MTMKMVSHGHAEHRRPAPVRKVKVGQYDCLDNGRVVIGLALALNPKPPVATRDDETLQQAFLDPRTARPASVIARIAGALWSKA